MAYASKYYDPDKAHDYYMRTRELIGYEDRYGGWRGNGTSGGSSGVTRIASGNSVSGSISNGSSGNSYRTKVTRIASAGTSNRSSSNSSSGSNNSSQKSTSTRNAGEVRTASIRTLSDAVFPVKYTVRASTGNDDLDNLLENYDKLRSGLKAYREDSKRNDESLRNDMRNASTWEDKIGFKDALDYNKRLYKQDTDKIKSDLNALKTAIKQQREAIKQEKQKQREEAKRQREEAKKEKQRQREEAKRQREEARQQQREKKTRDTNAQHEIQNRLNSERDNAIKKVNKSVDDDMLTETKRFVDKVNKQRKSGKQINNKVILSQLRALSGRAKKAKIKYQRQYTNDYKNKYKEELARYNNR
jgi:hypothetical protein